MNQSTLVVLYGFDSLKINWFIKILRTNIEISVVDFFFFFF